MPTISIIIPVYNAELYLRQCIESVIAQTFEDWEAILVNDGSKDGSLAICQEYAAKDKRIKVIDKPNGGVSSARNKGLEVAQGDWITFMDSDDWLDADAFEVYYEAAQRTRADIVKTGYRYHKNTSFGGETVEREITLTEKSDVIALLQKTHYEAYMCNTLVLSKIAKGLRFDESTPWLEDQFFGYECLLRARKVTLLPKMVYNYRIHESGSLSHVSNPFVIANAANKDMKYKLLLFSNNNIDVLKQCWKSYHQFYATAIDLLYTKGYSYSERKRFRNICKPLDCIYLYAEEKKFFSDTWPFWLNDVIERTKRFLKNIIRVNL